MKVTDLTIKQMASICKKHNKDWGNNTSACDENCPLFISVDACFLARYCSIVMDDKFSTKEIDQHFIESEIIDDTFYMNRFTEVN